jgi:hypothetical protein
MYRGITSISYSLYGAAVAVLMHMRVPWHTAVGADDETSPKITPAPACNSRQLWTQYSPMIDVCMGMAGRHGGTVAEDTKEENKIYPCLVAALLAE